jgi:hypothetical protein
MYSTQKKMTNKQNIKLKKKNKKKIGKKKTFVVQ